MVMFASSSCLRGFEYLSARLRVFPLLTARISELFPGFYDEVKPRVFGRSAQNLPSRAGDKHDDSGGRRRVQSSAGLSIELTIHLISGDSFSSLAPLVRSTFVWLAAVLLELN